MTAVTGSSDSQEIVARVASADLNKELGLQGRLLVQCGDGIADICEESAVRQLAFFKTIEGSSFAETWDRKVDLPTVSHVVFQQVYQYVVEKKMVHEIFTPEVMIANPDCFEQFVAALDFLHPVEEKKDAKDGEEKEKRVQQLKSRLQPLMTLETARKLIAVKALPAGLEAAPNADPAKSDKDEKPTIGPCFIRERAQEVEQFAYVFQNDAEAKEYFQMLCSYQIEKEFAEEHLARIEVALVRHQTTAHRAFIAPTMLLQRTIIAKCEAKLVEAGARIVVDSMTLSQLASFTNRTDIQHPKIVELQGQAKAKLVQHKEQVIAAFKGSGADITRNDLLEYFVGPKGYLLDHYGMVVDPEAENPKFPFKKLGLPLDSRFEYSLKHNSIYDVEQEIRADLGRVRVALPEPLVAEQKRTKPQADAVIKLRFEILPILKDWQNESDMAKTAVKQQLLNHWKWTQVKPEQLECHPNGESLTKERLLVSLGNRVRMLINLWDCTTHYDSHDVITDIPASSNELTAGQPPGYRLLQLGGGELPVMML